MNRNLASEITRDLQNHPATLLLTTSFNERQGRNIRWIKAIAPWHWKPYFLDGDMNAYDGLLRDGVESERDNGLPEGTLGGNNDYLCAVGSEEFEVMVMIARAFAEIGESSETFDLFWDNPSDFLRDRGLANSYRRYYPLEIQCN